MSDFDERDKEEMKETHDSDRENSLSERSDGEGADGGLTASDAAGKPDREKNDGQGEKKSSGR